MRAASSSAPRARSTCSASSRVSASTISPTGGASRPGDPGGQDQLQHDGTPRLPLRRLRPRRSRRRVRRRRAEREGARAAAQRREPRPAAEGPAPQAGHDRAHHPALRARDGGGGGAPTTPGTTTTPTGPANVGCATSACSFDVTGSVTAVDDDSGAITVMPLSGGTALTALPGTLNTDDVFEGDFVHITGTQSARDRHLHAGDARRAARLRHARLHRRVRRDRRRDRRGQPDRRRRRRRRVPDRRDRGAAALGRRRRRGPHRRGTGSDDGQLQHQDHQRARERRRSSVRRGFESPPTGQPLRACRVAASPFPRLGIGCWATWRGTGDAGRSRRFAFSRARGSPLGRGRVARPKGGSKHGPSTTTCTCDRRSDRSPRHRGGRVGATSRSSDEAALQPARHQSGTAHRVEGRAPPAPDDADREAESAAAAVGRAGAQ